MVIVDRVAVTIEEKEVLRLLGYKKGVSPKSGIIGLVATAIDEGYHLIQPRAAWTLVNVGGVTKDKVRLESKSMFALGNASKHWMGAECLGVALCTIGSALEKRTAELFAEGEFALASILDSVGSVAVESAADYVNFVMCQKATSLGLKTSVRLSPGYGRWNLRDQNVIFSIIDGEKVGVCLSEQCLMSPMKSISFCVALGKALPDTALNPCRRCGMQACRYRRDA